jgi:SSS family solute:Na+ symporter
MVQRVLASKDEWHARMGVIGAGYLHIITPFFFVFPGIIAYKLLGPSFKPADSAYLVLVERLVWPGLRGLILAAMAAALMSNLSAVLNSASTLITIDFYTKLIRPDASDAQQVRFGRLGGTLILSASTVIAWYISLTPGVPLFVKVQNVFFFIAPPFSVVFCAGLLWRRANTPGALVTIFLGFVFSFLFDEFVKGQQGVYLHRAFFTWCFCVIVMGVASVLTRDMWQGGAEEESSRSGEAVAAAGGASSALAYAVPTTRSAVARALSTPPPEQIATILWTRRYARLPEGDRRRYRGIKDFRLWWVLFVGIVLTIYAVFLWFRLQHPVKMLPDWLWR